MSAAEAAGRAVAQRGQNIYVYNNLRTSQVVYSLDRAVHKHAALKQLPFAGKKTVPASLRKDIWMPLFAVSFPSTSQGFSAYRRLREYRKLHEHNWQWTPPSETEIDRLEKDEKPYKKRKHVARAIMDQKANSIADLAAILYEQESEGEQFRQKEEGRQAEAEKKHQEKWEEMERLAPQARDSQAFNELKDSATTDKMRQHCNDMERALYFVDKFPELKDYARSREFARIEAFFKDCKRRYAKRYQSLPFDDYMDQQVKQMRDVQTAESKEKADSWVSKWWTSSQDAISQDSQPSEPSETAEPGSPAVLVNMIEDKKLQSIPKHGPHRKALLGEIKGIPKITLEGVKIRWADIMDASYAARWPRAVIHDQLVRTSRTRSRYTLTDPNSEQVQEKEQGHTEEEAEEVMLDGEASEEVSEEAEEQEQQKEKEKEKEQEQEQEQEHKQDPERKKAQGQQQNQQNQQRAVPDEGKKNSWREAPKGIMSKARGMLPWQKGGPSDNSRL